MDPVQSYPALRSVRACMAPLPLPSRSARPRARAAPPIGEEASSLQTALLARVGPMPSLSSCAAAPRTNGCLPYVEKWRPDGFSGRGRGERAPVKTSGQSGWRCACLAGGCETRQGRGASGPTAGWLASGELIAGGAHEWSLLVVAPERDHGFARWMGWDMVVYFANCVLLVSWFLLACLAKDSLSK